MLAGAWRNTPDTDRTQHLPLERCAPLLLQGGVGSLVWWSVRDAELARTPAARPLRQAYRLSALGAKLHAHHLTRAVSVLRTAGVEPLLAKGWAVARLYPEPGLRPPGDIDLCVRPEQYAKAKAALRQAEPAVAGVDLHDGLSRDTAFARMDDRGLEALYERSTLVALDGVPVRILGPEDHLRLLCLHMLGHGAWRPLWLCDVAVALESRPPGFDWEACLSGDERRSDWVICALRLAHQLLGAEIGGTPLEDRAQCLPRWLVPTVLRQWETGSNLLRRRSLGFALRHPSRLLTEMRQHWRSPIEATVELHAPFNEWPRLPFQLLAFLRRAPVSPRRWVRAIANQATPAT